MRKVSSKASTFCSKTFASIEKWSRAEVKRRELKPTLDQVPTLLTQYQGDEQYEAVVFRVAQVICHHLCPRQYLPSFHDRRDPARDAIDALTDQVEKGLPEETRAEALNALHKLVCICWRDITGDHKNAVPLPLGRSLRQKWDKIVGATTNFHTNLRDEVYRLCDCGGDLTKVIRLNGRACMRCDDNDQYLEIIHECDVGEALMKDFEGLHTEGNLAVYCSGCAALKYDLDAIAFIRYVAMLATDIDGPAAGSYVLSKALWEMDWRPDFSLGRIEEGVSETFSSASYWSDSWDEALFEDPDAMTMREWQAIVLSQGGLCALCNQPGYLTADHIIPRSRGGANNASNIQALCPSCNSKKGTRDWNEVRAYSQASIVVEPRPKYDVSIARLRRRVMEWIETGNVAVNLE